MKPDQIKFIMDTFGLSQKALARALNVGPYTVVRWKKGETEPVGLQLEVLQGLYNTAVEVRKEEDKKKQDTIAGLITLGIGALLFFLLTKSK